MSACSHTPSPSDINAKIKRKLVQPQSCVKRSQSVSPAHPRPRSYLTKGTVIKRRHSLSPSAVNDQTLKKPNAAVKDMFDCSSAANKIDLTDVSTTLEPEKQISLPQEVLTKSIRSFTSKKREFIKIKKNLIDQQNQLLETYASMREIESKVGQLDNSLGDVQVVSVTGWPAHDIILLLRNDITSQLQQEVDDGFAAQMLRQLQTHLNSIPDEVRRVTDEMIGQRNDILQLMRSKYRIERTSYHTTVDWKQKNADLDSRTEKLTKITEKLIEHINSKIKMVLQLSRVPWIDRESLAKRIERLQNENTVLQHNILEVTKRHNKDSKEVLPVENETKVLSDQLTKERSDKESLKEVVLAAESMLRIARTRIGTLERKLKEVKSELETTRRKQKESEQLYRHRELHYDSRSKKLLELSKTGEVTIATLSRQRDALELRVKELLEQTMSTEQTIADQEAELKARNDALQAKEKEKSDVESRALQLEDRIKELEGQLIVLQGQCAHLVNVEKEHCLRYLPSKESEPSDRETEIWSELQIARAQLLKAEDELLQSRADKETFLNSLSRIAQEEGDKQNIMASELLDREQRISRLQSIIEEQRGNERVMEQTMTEYENQLAALRLEVKRLRSYNCYERDASYQDLKTELLELQMQVSALQRERSELVTAAASRALMLERHERAADLFAKVTRARRELVLQLQGRSSLQSHFDGNREASQSMSSLCVNAAENWSALQAERARVLQLESAILVQSIHLDREDRVRTQLERRRSVLERELLRQQVITPECSTLSNTRKFMI